MKTSITRRQLTNQSNIIISKAISHALFIFHGRKKFSWKKHDVFWLARFLYAAIRIIVGPPFVGNRDEMRLWISYERIESRYRGITRCRLDPLPDNKGMSLKNGPSFLIQPLDRANPLAARDIFTLSRVTASKRKGGGKRGGLRLNLSHEEDGLLVILTWNSMHRDFCLPTW